MNRFAGGTISREQQKVVILDIGKMRVDVEQTVVTLKPFVRHVPSVQSATGSWS